MTNQIQTLKRNLMLIIVLISIIAGMLIVWYQHSLVEENFHDSIEILDTNVHNSYQVILEHLSKEISMKTDSILKKEGIKEAFFTANREDLQALVVPFYKRMSEQNPYLKIMTFRLVDGSTFLRVHKPEMFGDKLNHKRKIILDTNKLQKRHFGFEVGKLKMTYRVVTPIFYKNQHIGLVEIGIEPEYITTMLGKLFNVQKALLVKQESISTSLDKKEHFTLSDFVFIRGDALFTKYIQEVDLEKETTITTDEKKHYLIDTDLDLLNHKDAVSAKLLLAYDIDGHLNKLSRVTKNSIMFVVLSTLALMLVLNFLLGFFTQKINALNLTLTNKAKELEKAQKLAQIGSWQLDVKKDTLIWSDETYRIFGIDKTLNPTITLEDFFNTIHPDDLEEVSDAYTNHLATQEPYSLAHRLLLKNGDIKYVEEVCESTFDEDENPLISIGTVQDITARKEIELSLQQKEQQLIQQSRLAQMGEMISMIAHQWRQPLTAISATTGNLSFKLMMDDVNKEEFEEEIELIGDYAQHLSKTIDDFRGFFKENKEKEMVSLDEIVESTLTIAKISAENKNITIKTNLHAKTQVETFSSELKQVLLNLIKNAEDALLEKEIVNPTIMIETSHSDNMHILVVKDNAGGIPADIITKVFDPYFSTKLEKDGTGLGLYMSKTIVQEHCKGSITVENNAHGAVFMIKIRG